MVEVAFTSDHVANLENDVRETVYALLDRVADRNEFDLMAAIATPLPVDVIANVIRVPAEDRNRFEEWSDPIRRMTEPLLTPDEQRLTIKAN